MTSSGKTASAHKKKRMKPAGANRLIVRKWGNSAGIRIPMNAMNAAKLKLDQEVDVYAEDGKIVIDPIVRKKYRLKDLLEALTPENSYDFCDADRPAGQEVW